jgi:hypothetical protein
VGIRRFHLPGRFEVSGSSGPTGASLGLSLPDGYQALTALDPPVATITERRIPNLALPVREPGSLSDDMAIVERHRMTGINEDDGFGQRAD